MESYSYWEKEAFLKNYDLVIVGAGIVGLSSALFAKETYPDRSVLVLERGHIPQGASTRNAGFACIGSIGEHQADLERSTQDEVKRRIKRRYEGLRLLKKTLGEDAIDYVRCGGYELFTSAEEFERAKREIDRFNGWLAEILDEKEVYRDKQLNGYPVIYNRLEGALHPGRMMRALIGKVLTARAEIRWNSPVKAINNEGLVTFNDGSAIEADQVLVAVNGFSRKLLPESVQVKPGRGYVFVTNPIGGLPWRGTFHHDRGYIYFRNIGDRLLLGGARNIAEQKEETDEFGHNQLIKNHLTRFGNETLKLPDGWEIEYEWSGIMGFTENKTPIVQRINNKVSVAVGLSGMGVAIGMEVGREAASLVFSPDSG